MTGKEIINYWISSSDDNYQTMQNLFNSGDYTWALFMGHLIIEKLLKACIIKFTDTEPPFTHDLLRIAQKAELHPDEKNTDMLDEITTFNIKCRYDDYKQNFKKQCTKEFTEKKIQDIMEIRQWLIKKLLI